MTAIQNHAVPHFPPSLRFYDFPTEESAEVFTISAMDYRWSRCGKSVSVCKQPFVPFTAEEIEVLDGAAKILYGKVIEKPNA